MDGDAHGDTALHKAVRFDCAAIVKAMLKTKPDTNVQGREERTPLHEAALYNHSQCAAELLVPRGVCVCLGGTPRRACSALPAPLPLVSFRLIPFHRRLQSRDGRFTGAHGE